MKSRRGNGPAVTRKAWLAAQVSRLRRLRLRLRISIEIVEPEDAVVENPAEQRLDFPPVPGGELGPQEGVLDAARGGFSQAAATELPQSFSTRPRMHRDARFLARK